MRSIGIAAALALAVAACAQETAPPRPYHDPGSTPRSYGRPGSDEPEPFNAREVPIAFFGPADPAHPAGGQIWQGASLAIEEANLQGGYSIDHILHRRPPTP